MVDLDNLRVSLTKNGYLKIARLVAAHSSHEILGHAYGSIPGVNLIPSQVANVLCADPVTNVVPSFWDDVRTHGRATIKAFTFLSVLFSHHRLVRLFVKAGRGTPRGTISRSDFATEKEYTNLAFALAELDASPYVRGAGEVEYDLTAVTNELQDVGELVGRMLRAKLLRCGWRDPDEYRAGGDRPFAEECKALGFHRAIGMADREFTQWIAPRPRRPR